MTGTGSNTGGGEHRDHGIYDAYARHHAEHDDFEPIPAATVVVLRDGDAGIEAGAPSPAYLTHQLVELVPALDLVLRSGYRLCGVCSGDSLDIASYGTQMRYLFCLGLLASGLRAPERSEQGE